MAMDLTRRNILAGTAAAALGGPSASPTQPTGRRRSLRIAHLTDVHVQPEKRAGEGMAAAFAHAQSHKDRPDLILTGGDMVMNAFGASRERTKTQWDLWQRTLQDSLTTPIEHCIGNHDVWNWPREGGEPERGKRWAMDALNLERPYRSFERAGWKFIVLDSTYPRDTGYVARLDDAQFEWLEGELAATSRTTPVLVLSHIPILAACAYFDGDNEKDGDWKVPGAWMHLDARKIVKLFHRHGNVKVALSGHIHLVDRVDYLGTTYLCNGAVCGGWWGGNYQECEPGYALVDLYADGTFESRYVTYGWKAEQD